MTKFTLRNFITYPLLTNYQGNYEITHQVTRAYLFLFWDWGSKIDASIGGVHNVPKIIDDGPISVAPSKNEKKGYIN
jgi:hypothetical protein